MFRVYNVAIVTDKRNKLLAKICTINAAVFTPPVAKNDISTTLVNVAVTNLVTLNDFATSTDEDEVMEEDKEAPSLHDYYDLEAEEVLDDSSETPSIVTGKQIGRAHV